MLTWWSSQSTSDLARHQLGIHNFKTDVHTTECACSLHLQSASNSITCVYQHHFTWCIYLHAVFKLLSCPFYLTMVGITLDLVRRHLPQLSANDRYADCQELSLHQSNITELNKTIQQLLPNLRILYLQNNYISTIEHIYKLKSLQYLNLAINNITVIPQQIGRLESLQKLDLTLNFIPQTKFHSSLLHLRPCIHLTDITLLGNPCAVQYNEWYNKQCTQHNGSSETQNRYRLYVISVLCNNNTADYCNLKRLDGTDITPTELILAKQLSSELHTELQHCIDYYTQHPIPHTTYTAEQRLADYEAQLQFDNAQQQSNTALDAFTPPVNPVDLHKQQLKQRVVYDEYAPLPVQRNTGKYTYNVDYSAVTTTGSVQLRIEVPVSIQLEQIEVDMQERYVQCLIDGDNLLVHMQYDYLIATDRCKVQRITLTGELLVHVAVQQYVHMIGADSKHNISIDYSNVNNTLSKRTAAHSAVSNDVVSDTRTVTTAQPVILKRATNCRQASSAVLQTAAFVDDSDVPPLE